MPFWLKSKIFFLLKTCGESPTWGTHAGILKGWSNVSHYTRCYIWTCFRKFNFLLYSISIFQFAILLHYSAKSQFTTTCFSDTLSFCLPFPLCSALSRLSHFLLFSSSSLVQNILLSNLFHNCVCSLSLFVARGKKKEKENGIPRNNNKMHRMRKDGVLGRQAHSWQPSVS